jgi:4'-phosphopantetheinyl transferase
MSMGAGERIREHFSARSVDWTPAPMRHIARVLYAPLSDDPEITGRCKSVLSETEQDRARRFASPSDRASFVQRRAFRRYCASLAAGHRRPMSQMTFSETEKGRPFLAEWPAFCFSFSSCELGFVGAWSVERDLGIDFESPMKGGNELDMARHWFLPCEIQHIERQGVKARRAFIELWTLKEAALKSIGEGLPFGLDAFSFELKPEPRVVRAPGSCGDPGRFDARFVGRSQGCAALVTCR